MNCCDDDGRCVGGTGCAARSREEIGGFLSVHDTDRMPLGSIGHGPALAPGVIEGYRTPIFGTRRQRRELWRTVRAVVWWMLMIAGCGFALGLIVGAHP